MGEAKRRGQLGRQAAEQLRLRIAAGDFGPAATGYLFVLDKSPAGQELLGVMRGVANEFPGLAEALEAEDLRLWTMSPLFAYAVVHGADRATARRVRLASTLQRLVDEALPGAVRSLSASGHRWSVLTGLSEPARSAAGTALESLGRAG